MENGVLRRKGILNRSDQYWQQVTSIVLLHELSMAQRVVRHQYFKRRFDLMGIINQKHRGQKPRGRTLRFDPGLPAFARGGASLGVE